MAINANEKSKVDCQALDKTCTLKSVPNGLNRKIQKPMLLILGLLENQKRKTTPQVQKTNEYLKNMVVIHCLTWKLS